METGGYLSKEEFDANKISSRKFKITISILGYIILMAFVGYNIYKGIFLGTTSTFMVQLKLLIMFAILLHVVQFVMTNLTEIAMVKHGTLEVAKIINEGVYMGLFRAPRFCVQATDGTILDASFYGGNVNDMNRELLIYRLNNKCFMTADMRNISAVGTISANT